MPQLPKNALRGAQKRPENHPKGLAHWGSPEDEPIGLIHELCPRQGPHAGDAPACDAIELIVVPRSVDLGGFSVRRALPHAKRRMVGPFIFFDHIGPAEFRAGQGMDVRPHPHIGLATVTFLFAGEIMHRDSLGSSLPIRPGDVNWMTAGRGIVHSERTAPERRAGGEPLHGLQCWVALPANAEETDPMFAHDRPRRAPGRDRSRPHRARCRRQPLGARSPVPTLWDTLFAEVTLAAGATMPFDAATEERALYVIDGEIDIAGDHFAPGRLLIFRPGDAITIAATSDARIVLLGGAAMDGPRHIWWNFVSSRRDRIEQAKADWKAGRFEFRAGRHGRVHSAAGIGAALPARQADNRRAFRDHALSPLLQAARSGSFCLTRPMSAQGSDFLSRLSEPSRLPRLRSVYWLADLSRPSSSQVTGTDTGAPSRARVE